MSKVEILKLKLQTSPLLDQMIKYLQMYETEHTNTQQTTSQQQEEKSSVSSSQTTTETTNTIETHDSNTPTSSTTAVEKPPQQQQAQNTKSESVSSSQATESVSVSESEQIEDAKLLIQEATDHGVESIQNDIFEDIKHHCSNIKLRSVQRKKLENTIIDAIQAKIQSVLIKLFLFFYFSMKVNSKKSRHFKKASVDNF